MESLSNYIDKQLSLGKSYFSKEMALGALELSPTAFYSAATRLIKKKRLANPKRGFYLILRPEDQLAGAPEPARWIDPLMQYIQSDYRISLLRAAAFHGASHQSAMVFQVIVPKQMDDIEIGRHRIQFVYQSPAAFKKSNQPEWLSKLKTSAGYASIAGIELTLFDSVLHLKKTTGINGVAQIIKDIGNKAKVSRLSALGAIYQNTAVRRLGYLLEQYGHLRQSKALELFVKKAKSFEPLVPSIKPLIEGFNDDCEKNAKWKLIINEQLEIDF